MQIEILIQLLLAHFLTDFVLQPPRMVKSKNSNAHKSFYFWIHIILTGTLTYVLLMQWSNWQVPLFIMLTHGFIDLWKIRQENKIADNNKKTGTLNFFLDQLFHLIVLLIAWLYIIKGFGEIIPFIESLITGALIASLSRMIAILFPIFLVVAFPNF